MTIKQPNKTDVSPVRIEKESLDRYFSQLADRIRPKMAELDRQQVESQAKAPSVAVSNRSDR